MIDDMLLALLAGTLAFFLAAYLFDVYIFDAYIWGS